MTENERRAADRLDVSDLLLRVASIVALLGFALVALLATRPF